MEFCLALNAMDEDGKAVKLTHAPSIYYMLDMGCIMCDREGDGSVIEDANFTSDDILALNWEIVEGYKLNDMEERRNIELAVCIDCDKIPAVAIGPKLNFFDAIEKMQQGKVMYRKTVVYHINQQTGKYRALVLMLREFGHTGIDCNTENRMVAFTLDEISGPDAWQEIDPASIGLELDESGNYIFK